MPCSVRVLVPGLVLIQHSKQPGPAALGLCRGPMLYSESAAPGRLLAAETLCSALSTSYGGL
jgi:hypothetical protein